MEGMKSSETVFNVAKALEEQLVDVQDNVKREEIKQKIEGLFELVNKMKENEKEIENLNEKVETPNLNIFEDLSIEEKTELEDTISAHLKRALELLKEKGKDKLKEIAARSKDIIEEMTGNVNSMYNSSIEFVEQKREETRSKIAVQKEEKKLLKEQAIEQLKMLGKDDEIIMAFQEERDGINEELDTYYDKRSQIEGKIDGINKNSKALVKYEKKGFFSRFLTNLSELGKKEELSEEQKKEMIEKGEVPKKLGFFAKAKQAYAKTREQDREVQDKNEQLKEGIMQKFEDELEQKNVEIFKLENLLAENDDKREALEAEKKEKLIEIVKMGKIKAKELQEMVDNEIVFCSNPKMIVAQAKISTLMDKFSSILNFGKDKEVEKEAPKPVEKETTRNSGMDR